MRTPSGILHVVDFQTEQIVSTIQSKDYWDDKRHWEIKNNIDKFDFTTADGTEQAATLLQQNLVLKEVRSGVIVPYVITEAEKVSNDRSVITYASGEWILLAKAGVINPQRIEGKTVNEFIDIALTGTKWKRGRTEYSGFHTMTINEPIDPLKLLKDIASLFDLEIVYRAEVVGNQFIGRYVDMVKKRGREIGKEVTLGKDLMGIKRIENSQNICTALIGFVKGEGDKIITVESINNGLPYIVDNDAFQRWNEKGKHKFGFYTPETEQDITPGRLMTLMKTEMKKRVNTSVSYEVEAQSIGRVFGLAHELINEGDTIRIKDTGFTPKLYLEARAIAGDESFKDPMQDKYVFGDYREIVDPNEELRKLYNKVLASLGSKQEILDQLDKLVKETAEKANDAQKESESAKKIAEKVQENLKNNTVNIIEAKNPPIDNLIVGKTLWRDISNGKPGILKVWNGKGWELLIPDVESIKKDTLEQVSKDIKLTKEELNKKVEEAQEEATGQFNTVTEGLSKVTRTISDVQRDQGEIDKKVTQVEQDSEKFKLSIETLTKNSTETTSKVNTLVSDVDGNKKVISEVKESVANFNDDVRNLLVGSKSFDGALAIAQADNRWWLKSADKVKISKDVFQGNTVVETQSSWTALAYNFKDLVDRKVVKVGDKVTYSIFTRVKGLPDGQDLQHTFYFAPGATGIRPNKSNNQWQRVSVSFTVTASMMSSTGTDNESHFRVEPDANPPAGCWYQQSSPQLIITIGNKEYSWRPAPEDIADGNVLTKVTTEIKEAAGKISEKLTKVETKVNNDKSGGRNLLLDSNTKYEKIDYLINPYSLTENFVAGEEYTFVIKGSVPQGQQFGIWQNGGTNHVGYATSAYANGITYVTFKAVATTSGNERRLNLYNYPNNATKATVEWVALYKGNKPQDWTPAPENQVTNDEFTKKTTEIEKSVDGIKESIKTVEKTQTFFDERVNTVEKNAEGTTASVKKLQETQTAQGKTISEATTTIGQHSEALKLTMKKKDVEDYVGGLGSINDLRNAAFAQGFKYWTQNGNSAVIDSSVTYRGYTTAKLHATGLTEDKWYSLHQTIDVTAGEDVVASGYFMSNNIGQGFVLEIEYLNAQGSRVSQASIGIDVTANSNWIRSVVSGTVPAGAVKARYKPWVRRNGTLWIALPMLQRGKVATEFWLHPKDQTDIDKMIDDIANKVATEKYNQKVTELERSISATEKGVSIISGKQETFINETYNAYVKKTESKLEVLDEGILAQILKDGIVTAINMSPGKITINAAKLDINADTMVKWLTAKGIDTNLIRISGDKITIDGEEGVIVNMLDFLFKDEWGTKTTAVSRRNLIADPDFSSVTKKNIGHNDYYGFEGGYGLTWKSWGNVVIEKNTHIFDYEQMVNAARVDMYNYPEAIVNNGIHPGNEYTVSAHFRTAMINGVRKTGKPRLQVCCVKFRDNVSYDIWNEQKMDFPEPSTYYGEIRRYSFTFKVPTNYIPQQHALIIKVCSGNADMRQGTAICVSGVTLYSGKYASMYNWDRAAAERADGIQPFNGLAVGGVNNNITPAPDGQTFDISTEKEVKIFRNIRAMQGINLGGGGFQQWGHIRFTDGNMGSGFYASTPSGWKFNALG
ncbi:phage tail spike protein [Bacillus thuringiensis]|uniref:phage tail spike protein n=2 Tax=Bacillus thuringiensis TaxID=1428 RepID=UPI002D7F0462|nr:phage tail spike protein [Bacillus thuringiensis]MEB4893500.1 phage tail spike protein [Bacillus thuringiensis]MEC2471560.1 phage tail spike protein [Bacillus thuringiensis]MEC2560782.1 phage tail spike protein [Bacillus thuringiensis]MEC2726288.1 phage tail spike protein [Bacillus thuringiensis]MEC2747659.1 phage tail spike protein [Bacillus thuringiensis]